MQVVQVQTKEFSPRSSAYAWTGFFRLKVGAWVEVPYGNDIRVGKVVGIGAGGYDGPLKSVIRRGIDQGWATEVVRALAQSEGSSSKYLIRQFTDGSTLCECKAWQFAGGPYQTRSCKHTVAFHEKVR